jgi:AraC family transcriptional regulator
MLSGLSFTLPTNHGVATYPPGAAFGPRVMRDFEFVWIIEGDVEYRWGGITVPCPQGSIVLCRPGVTDFFRWDPHRKTRHGFYHFNITRIPRDWPKMNDWPLVRAAGQGGDILAPMFRYLLTWIGRGSEDLLRLSMAHLLTSFVLGEAAAMEVPPDPLPAPVERAEQLIRDRLDDDPAAVISLTDLADVALVTPEHLCRLFKSSIGRTPVRTVALARLDRAMTLVSRSNYSLKEIARMCGYSSEFHLSRRVKQEYGQSPRAVRQQIENGETPPLPRLLKTVRIGTTNPKIAPSSRR